MQSSAFSLAETIGAVVQEHIGRVGPLMLVLHAVQERLGYVPSAAIPMIASALSLSRAEVHGVMHFYHDFRAEPAGNHIIQLCRAEACQAMGARALEAHVRGKLGITFGETTPDGRFTLDPVYCLGNCACAPTVRIDDDIHARVTPQRFDELLADLQGDGR
ncbi:MAG: formate dehydrogenase subunit gamma [Xanthomonadales bacterium]|nr:formate dehydrogenase subunit gamma [Xanthomonadales bacterium]